MTLNKENYSRWEICNTILKTNGGLALEPGSTCNNSRVATTDCYGSKHNDDDDNNNRNNNTPATMSNKLISDNRTVFKPIRT